MRLEEWEATFRKWMLYVLLSLLGLFVVGLGLWIRHQKQRVIIRQIQQRGGWVGVDEPRGPEWLRNMLDEDALAHDDDVLGVTLIERADDDILERLHRLPNLVTVQLLNTAVTDRGVKNIEKISQLRRLTLFRTKISDSQLRHLKAISTLYTLQIVRTNINGSGLEHIWAMPSLRKLYLDGTSTNDDALRHVGRMSRLEYLSLSETKITGRGLRHIAGLKNLQRLYLDKAAIDDEAIDSLLKLTRLEFLFVEGTRITKAGILRLKEGLPGCSIVDKR
jgi:Leucine-rich repeat (LRR) protein